MGGGPRRDSQTLVLNKLRGRIAVQADGQMKTGRDVVIGALLGADEMGFATAPLVVEGCIMMRKCHLNTCPVGGHSGPRTHQAVHRQPEHVVNYFSSWRKRFANTWRRWYRKFEEMVGRADLLSMRRGSSTEGQRARLLGFLSALGRSGSRDPCARSRTMAWSGRRSKLIAQARPALENKSRVKIEMSIRNVNRTVGAMLSGEIAQRWGMLDYRTIRSHQDESTAGRSFGAFWLAV